MDNFIIVGVAIRNITIKKLKDMSLSNDPFKQQIEKDKERYFAFSAYLNDPTVRNGPHTFLPLKSAYLFPVMLKDKKM